MPVYAALDIGSNSVRMLVGEVEGGRVRPLLAELASSRLMAGFEEGRLQEAAIERTVTAVARLVEEARKFPLAGVAAVATSAAREAGNAGLLLEGLKEQAGLEVRIISGKEEAFLTFRGVRCGLPLLKREELLVVDVGGGSTELSWEEGGSLKLCSLPLGAVRCTENGMGAAAIREALEPVVEEIGDKERRRVVATGGTATTLAALEQGLRPYRPELVHGFSLSRERVRHWLGFLSSLPLEERRRLPGLQPERADIIVAGAAILDALLEGLRAQALTVSEADLLWGLLMAAAGEEELLCG